MQRWAARAPGLALVVVVALVAHWLAAFEVRTWGRTFVDPLVHAILIGMLVRAVLGAREVLEPGIGFAGAGEQQRLGRGHRQRQATAPGAGWP